MSTNNKKTSTAGSAETLFKVLHFIGRYRLLLISSIISRDQCVKPAS